MALIQVQVFAVLWLYLCCYTPGVCGSNFRGGCITWKPLPCLPEHPNQVGEDQMVKIDFFCDMIMGNESLVENVNFYFLTPVSQNLIMLHFYANPITIGYLVTEL